MIADAWWIIDPIGHREEDNKAKREWMAEEEEGFEKIAVGPNLPLDMWVCDFCNADIRLYGEDGTMLWVPMFLSNALCDECQQKEIVKDSESWMALLGNGNPLKYWSSNGCGCPPCKKRAEAIKKEMMAEMGKKDG